MAMRQQNMDDRRRAMMNEMYSRPGANGVSGQASAIANAAADEEEEGSWWVEGEREDVLS